MLSLALSNLLSPAVLFFLLGFAAALARSDLSLPEAAAKTLALYLMLAIGFKGGVEVASAGLSAGLLLTMLGGVALGMLLPMIGFVLLAATTGLDRINRAAIAAHYGSISVVTFVAGTDALELLGVDYDGFIIATMAAMETPAIIAGLLLAGGTRQLQPKMAREVFFNGAVVLLVGSFIIGWITGPEALERLKPFVSDPFRGVLCLFLLDMGLLAAARLRESRELRPSIVAFGLYMPLIGAACGLSFAALIGLSLGTMTLFAILCASASYIAVPAAMRLALPKASPGLYVTMSLAVTFPFNIVVGIPLYYRAAQWLTG